MTDPKFKTPEAADIPEQSTPPATPQNTRTTHANPTSIWPTSNISINATFWRRTLTLLLLLRIKDRKNATGVLLTNIPLNKIVKYGTSVHISEAAALELVAKHTTILVPKVHCAFVKNGVSYIVMQKLEGETLLDEWDDMPVLERDRVVAELKKYFEQLRGILHPRPGTICTALIDFEISDFFPEYWEYITAIDVDAGGEGHGMGRLRSS